MFQLRFLIGSPRRQSAHIFSHRDYRGQRTQQDDFHPQFNTYVCAPKGTPGTQGSKSSYDVMIELMEHSAQNQPASHLFPIIEVWNPETRERLKLAGDEIILRPSDLAAAQEAFNATLPAAPEPTPAPPVNNVTEVSEVPVPTEPATEPPAPPPPLLDRVRTEIKTNGKATATQLANTLGISAQAIKDAVNLPDSGLQNKGGWISLV